MNNKTDRNRPKSFKQNIHQLLKHPNIKRLREIRIKRIKAMRNKINHNQWLTNTNKVLIMSTTI